MSGPSASFVLQGLSNKDVKLLTQYRNQQSMKNRNRQGAVARDMVRNLCTVCNVRVCGRTDWENHLMGKKHQSKLNLLHGAQRTQQMVPKPTPEEYACKECSMKTRNPAAYEDHLNSKKHKQKVSAKAKAELGVFVGGLPPEVSSADLRKYFATFGELVEFVHTQGKNYLLLEYKTKKAVYNLLHTPIFVCGRKLRVRPRQYSQAEKAEKNLPPPGPQVNHEEVTKILTNGADLQLLIRELELDPGRDKEFNELCRDLEKVFRTDYPNCIAIPFGSTVTGLGLKNSDIDVFLNLQDAKALQASTSEAESGPRPPDPLVTAGKKLMYRNKQLFSHIMPVARAKTPIIKFNHRPTKIQCDVSFKNSFGMSNSKLIRFYISLDPRIRPYLMIIKYWGKVHDLSGSGRMSNYALVMKSLFYLMQLDKPVIPTVAELQAPIGDEDLVDGWLWKFNEDRSAIKATENTDSVFKLLYGFFRYYGEFDYGGHVICTRIGKVVPKSSFATPEMLPDSLRLYKERKVARELRFSEMCVQDPFELTHNLTVGLSAKSVTIFCSFCQLAAKALESAVKGDNNSEWGPALIKVLDEKLKPPNRKYVKLTKTGMKMNINVGQHLSLAYALDAGREAVAEDPDAVRKIKIYKWFRLVHELFMRIMEKVMKFSITEQSDDESSSKVQKVDESSDVHLKSNETLFPTRTYQCKSLCNVWDGRKSILKSLKLPTDMYVLKKEELISDVILEKRGKKSAEGRVKFKCTFEPKLDPVQVALTFANEGSQDNEYFNTMGLLQTRIPVWIENSMDWFKTHHLLPQKDTPSDTGVNDEDVVLDSDSLTEDSEISEASSEVNFNESDTEATLDSSSAADNSIACEAVSKVNLN